MIKKKKLEGSGLFVFACSWSAADLTCALSCSLSLSVSSVPIVLIYSAFNPDQQTVSAVEKSRHTPLHAFISFSYKGDRDPESCDGSRRLKVLLFLPPLGRSASPPDGLSPFNAGVAARRTAAARGRRWEGTESRWIDLRTAVGAPWGTAAHDTWCGVRDKSHAVIMKSADGLSAHLFTEQMWFNPSGL